MKRFSSRGSALIITIFITTILMMIGLYLLEKIIPVSRSVKWIENSNVAYYQAQTAVEAALYAKDPSNPGVEFSSGSTSGSTSWNVTTTSSGTSIPILWQGNSEFDHDWSRIGIGQPVQLKLPAGINNWGSVEFHFRVPDLDRDGSNTETLSGGSSTGAIISWILTGSGDSLYASGSQAITDNYIRVSDVDGNGLMIEGKEGVTISGSGKTFWGFYGENCMSNPCSLKLGVINPLILSDGGYAPYLEYKITGFATPVPQQYAVINAAGYSVGFKQNIQKQVQQTTTNEALDFTIFQ